MGGYTWTWSHRGAWTVRAGSILEPGVEVTGPAGSWKCPPASLLAADLVMTLLRLADALPPARGQGTVYPGNGFAVRSSPGAYRGADVVVVDDPHREIAPGDMLPDTRPAGMGPGAAYAPQRADLVDADPHRSLATGSAATGPCADCPTLPDCTGAQRCARTRPEGGQIIG
jgi:hypothetical protein